MTVPAAVLDLVRDYAAGAMRREHWLWGAGDPGPNAAGRRNAGRMRARIRDLVRNDPYARRILDVLSANAIGEGIVPRAMTGNERRDGLLMAAWREWAETEAVDVAGLVDVYGLQEQAYRAWKESGEVFLRRVPVERAQAQALGLPLPLQIQVLEAEHLAAWREGSVEGGGRIVEGIEMDAQGRRLAYHFVARHPGEVGTLPTREAERVPAADVIHLFKARRPGQLRGVPELHAVALRVRALQDYHEALLFRAKIEACLAAFVTTDADAAGAPLGADTALQDGQRLEQFEPGMVTYLKPGEAVTIASPTGSGAHNDYSRQSLQAIAVGAGITYDQLTGDLTQANYSSLRAGKIEFRRMIRQEQWQVLVPRLCARLWRWMVDAGGIAGRWPLVPAAAEWTPPRFEPIDPLKDVQADVLEVKAGFKTWSQAVAERGWHADEQIAEIRDAAAKLAAAGVVLPELGLTAAEADED